MKHAGCISDGEELSLRALVCIAPEDEVDRLLGLVVVESCEVLSVILASLFPCGMGVPGSLLFVSGVQRLQRGRGQFIERRWGESGKVEGVRGEGVGEKRVVES